MYFLKLKMISLFLKILIPVKIYVNGIKNEIKPTD